MRAKHLHQHSFHLSVQVSETMPLLCDLTLFTILFAPIISSFCSADAQWTLSTLEAVEDMPVPVCRGVPMVWRKWALFLCGLGQV